MRFGILYNKNNVNIGDDIQTYALKKFLPQVDYFIDSEHLDDFVTDNKETCAVIMNYNYSWAKWNWPPSRYIYPFFTSFYYGDYENAKLPVSPVENEFLTGIGGEYLKSFGKIGCTNKFTENILIQSEVETFFSGDITLTLPKQEEKEDKNSYICLVDLSEKVVEKIKEKLKDSKIEIREYNDNISGKSKLSWEEREQKVKNRLTVYQNAKSVITSNLKCALPCLAMEVPVLYIQEEKEISFAPYDKYLNVEKAEKILKDKSKIDFENLAPNSDKYKKLRENLITSCNDFVNKAKDLPSDYQEHYKLSYTDKEIMIWRHNNMKKLMDKWLLTNRKHLVKGIKMRRIINENKRFKETLITEGPGEKKTFIQKVVINATKFKNRMKKLFSMEI